MSPRFASRTESSGERREKSATVAQVAEPVLAVLDQTVPFGYFDIAVRGCISPKTFRVVALDAGGNIARH